MKKRPWLFLSAAAVSVAAASVRALAATASPFYMGSDVSMLPFIESRGGTYRDGGQVRPAEQILVNHGDNLFRLRLFVNPSTNYDDPNNHGDIQTEAYDIALAQRLKATGAKILLDLHYSDVWADPSHQTKPAAWASQDWATLQSTVRSYTSQTLTDFKNAGVMPDMVQIGNEVTNGMLFGTTVSPPNGGQVVYTGTTQNQNQSWQNFGTMLNAAIAGVRDVDSQTPGQHTDIAIHCDGGNVTGRAAYYFGQITGVAGVPASSFDTMGMSFYGTTNADVGTLQSNLTSLANTYSQKLMVMETNHAWKGTSSGSWPSTPQGQSDFLASVRDTVKNLPNGKGAGLVYWYPESIQVPSTFMWQSGGVALFDDDTDGSGPDGHDAMTAINQFSTTTPTWNVDSSGTWYNAMNWTGGVPLFAGNAATFSSAITVPRTVTLDAAHSVGSMTFDNAAAGYTIAGSATLTLDATSGSAATVTVNSGTHSIGAPFALADNTTFNIGPAAASLTVSNLMPAAGVSITKTGSGTLSVNRLAITSSVNITGGTIQIRPDGSNAAVSRIGQLVLANGVALDLGDNKLIVTTTPIGSFNGSAYTGLTGLVESGRGGGATGITTSQTLAAVSNLATIGIASAADVRPNTATATGTWAGQTITGTDTLVMYTFGGDATLDGRINIDDYIRIDSGIASGLTGWSNGDFNYDGKINIDDYTQFIDANVGTQGAPFPTGDGLPQNSGQASPVPEPLTWNFVAGITIAAVRMRREKNRSRQWARERA